MKTDTLLVEVRTEELPPPAVRVLAKEFPNELLRRLIARGFAGDGIKLVSESLATPRRFAALIGGVRAHTESRLISRRGPQVKDCYDSSGKPTPALRGFMRAVGVTDVTELAREKEKGREYFVWRGGKPGTALVGVLAQDVTGAMNMVSDLPFMRWHKDGDEYAFVRPVRGLVMMHGDNVISGEVMGVESGDETRGHPVLAAGAVKIDNAANYEDALKENSVIVDYRERAAALEEILENAMDEAGAEFLGGVTEREQIPSDKLKEEVVAMCEKPSRYICAVGEEFWDLPDDYVAICLIKHQRCFPLYVAHEEEGRNILRPSKFVFIADNETKDLKKITDGATAVVHARLQDLAFYLQTDKKLTEKEAREKLDGIVYHRKLGSQAERAGRIAVIADSVGKIMKLNAEESAALKRATEVCKLDLPTMTVGEYPELAGKMAAYHFCNKERRVASIVERHSDNEFEPYEMERWQLPAIALFLADKLEKIVGMFLADEKPAGRRDPHGLRRAAVQMTKTLTPAGRRGLRRAAAQIITVLVPRRLGFLGSLSDESAKIVQKLSLRALLAAARDAFPADLGAQNFDVAEAHEFISKRMSLSDTNAEISNAVYALRPEHVAEIPRRCKALQDFLHRDEAPVLIAANKRINNILRKSDAPEHLEFSERLLQEPVEKKLHKCVVSLEKKTQQLIAKGDYQKVLTILATDAAKPISVFFDKTMVNTDNHELRANRLALLIRLRAQLNSVADLAYLSIRK